MYGYDKSAQQVFTPDWHSFLNPCENSLALNECSCGHVHEEAFAKVKEEVSSPRVLAPYDLEKETKISADASAYGLGAVLLQEHGSDWRPVAFASRALTETESRYAQIEKEALALTWSCEKFSSYILGKPVQLETDHKPLVPILGH